MQRPIVGRAHRWVFARHPAPWVAQVRPRVVDQAIFVAEQEAWKHWHREQVEVEGQRSV